MKFGKIFFSVFLVVLLLIAICYGIFMYYLNFNMCGNTIFQEVYSPDKLYKVIIFERDCGATTGFSTQISILRADEKLKYKGGNIFRMDGHPDWSEIRVHWENNRVLVINYLTDYDVFYSKTTYSDFLTLINIKYNTPD